MPLLDQCYSDAIWHQINQKTKPVGALGELEKVAHQLALIQSNQQGKLARTINIDNPTVIVFAGDHGIADEGVSIAPSAVTQQMVLNFLAGGAAINCFCRANSVDLKVVDCGILLPVDEPDLIVQRLGERTNDLARQAAMTPQQLSDGLAFGQKLTQQVIDSGCRLLMFGEMGIANTSSASAILAALTELDVEQCVGLGTGISPEQLAKKVTLISQGVARCKGRDVHTVLAEVGGFEIVQMVGSYLAAAQNQTPVVVDGFIASVAAFAACQINPHCRQFMIFAHRSHESGHKYLLQCMEAEPLLDLSLRLGEGTGAVLAVPIIRAAAEFYNNMASFEQVGVEV
ncbi:nicotinate-nucleotide--dimethylbenzimidazole phosphoribosyltransferase [Vibrio sinaloensis]|uniref:nicotinate-nucleotide--dimethylbenzimidazole phosphoribosyltransferase n=1 Tax=Photobacterium sp. (strain ATCC 43367) TaxID=379097 RepID=UPI0035ECED06